LSHQGALRRGGETSDGALRYGRWAGFSSAGDGALGFDGGEQVVPADVRQVEGIRGASGTRQISSFSSSAPCDGHPTGVFARAAGGEPECHLEHRDCRATIAIELVNCTNESVVFEPLTLHRVDATAEKPVRYAPRPPVTPRSSRVDELTVQISGAYEIVLGTIAENYTDRLPTMTVDIDNRRERAACAECDGHWGRYGMSDHERCACRTKDAGKVCHDGDECQSGCLAEALEWVERPSDTRNANGGRYITMGVKRRVGHCNTSTDRSGCHDWIPVGASREPPSSMQWINSGRECAD
jgi:hypothetical protein